jgi:putative SOS response-associated peptidase YedK
LGKHARTDLDVARDELMSHIHRCGVLKASQEQQDQWLDDTMQYMAERYTSLTEEELTTLHEIGRRFCQPVISRVEAAESGEAADTERGEMAGAA